MCNHTLISNPTAEQARQKARWLVSLVQGSAALEGRGTAPEVLKNMEDRITADILTHRIEIDNQGVK